MVSSDGAPAIVEHGVGLALETAGLVRDGAAPAMFETLCSFCRFDERDAS